MNQVPAVSKRLSTLFLIGVCFLLGCSKTKHYETIPVKGVLRINGNSAANILIQSMPDVTNGVEGPTSTAVTDQKGEFVLLLPDRSEGAVPGRHIMTFFDMDEERPAQGENRTRPVRLDSKYSTARGGLSIDLKPDSLVEINLGDD